MSSSTLLYVPLFYVDDAGGGASWIPTDVTNQAADATFLANDIFQGYGITALFLEVDGQITTLDDSYVAGAVSKSTSGGRSPESAPITSFPPPS